MRTLLLMSVAAAALLLLWTGAALARESQAQPRHLLSRGDGAAAAKMAQAAVDP
jgi:hypothetical protein